MGLEAARRSIIGYAGSPGPQIRATIRNEDTPGNADRIRRAYYPLRVTARLDFTDEAEQWLPGWALRWTRTHVGVIHLDHPRLLGREVWVRAGDVRRRED
jgi:hypothetical protein